MKILFSLILLLSFPIYAQNLKVESDSYKSGKKIENKYVFNGFGCSGENVSPHIRWSKYPKETKYFAITIYDPDAPTGSGWWHWLVLNIPADINELKEGISLKTLPQGSLETRTDFNQKGYGGPCPPVGDKAHRYIIKVYALKDKVPLEADVPGAMAGYYINSLKIAEGKLSALYGR